MRAIFLCAALLVLSWARAQTPQGVFVGKINGYRQTGETTLVPAESVFAVQVLFNGRPPAGTAVVLRTPGGTNVALTRAEDGSYTLERAFATRAELDAAFPEGAYAVVVDARPPVPVQVTAAPDVAPARITGFDALQALPDPDVTVRWTAIPGVRPDDVLSLALAEENGAGIYDSGDSLSPFSVSFGPIRVPPGRPVVGELAYVALQVGAATSAPVVAIGRGFVLRFPLRVVPPAPTIEVAPRPVLAQVGANAMLWVQARGFELAYQWFRDGVAIPGATGPTLEFAGVRPADSGRYAVRVGNPSGATTSPAVPLAVAPALRTETFAGTPRVAGSADGARAAALFRDPRGLAFDAAGRLWVADSGNATIRRIAPDGTVTTVAGAAEQRGWVDGAGPAARFRSPAGIAVDRAGNAYVADSGDHVIRKISPAGTVSTLAGAAGQPGQADGAGAAARFNQPVGIAVDAAGVVYVADFFSHALRRIAPDGMVTTFAGRLGAPGFVDGTGGSARFNFPWGLALDPAGNVVVADRGNDALRRVGPGGEVATIGYAGAVRGPQAVAVDAQGTMWVAAGQTLWRITPEGAAAAVAGTEYLGGFVPGLGFQAYLGNPLGVAIDPSGGVIFSNSTSEVLGRGVLVPGSGDPLIGLETAPRPATIAARSSVVFDAVANGPELFYQWLRNGRAIPGATKPTLLLRNLAGGADDTYALLIGNAAGALRTQTVGYRFASPGASSRLANLSVRSAAGAGAQTLIVGFTVEGAAGTLPVLGRAVGPGLAPFGVTGTADDPRLTLFRNAAQVGFNDDWGANAAALAPAFAAVGAFALPAGARDSALREELAAGSYTLQVTNASGDPGLVLAELYDATAAASTGAPRLVNVSARTNVGRGGDVLIAGFAIGGTVDRTVLIRGIGPELASFGVQGVLANPRLELFSGPRRLAANDDWQNSAEVFALFSSVGAFGLGQSSRDAMLLLTLPPGVYSAQVSGEGGTTGNALVEIYEVP